MNFNLPIKDGARLYAAMDEVKRRQATRIHPDSDDQAKRMPDLEAAVQHNAAAFGMQFDNKPLYDGMRQVASFILHLRDVLTERHGKEYVDDLLRRVRNM